MASTRPSTPFYYFNDADSTSTGSDPPPGYSDGSPPSSVGSPRSSNEGPATNTVVDISAGILGQGRASTSTSSSSNGLSRSSMDDPFGVISSNASTASSSLSDSGSDNGIGASSAGGAESTARTLRFGRIVGAAGEESAFTSRLSSRAASPAPGEASSSSYGNNSGNTSDASSAVHHHIHHHYHHNSAGSTGSTASSLAKGKGKERCNSTDYAIPNDGYFNSGYNYRNGPLARKLGSAILSRDPSLSDLPTFAALSGGALPSPSIAHRRKSGWKSPRRKNTDLFDDGHGFTSLDTSVPYRNRRRLSAIIPIPVIKAWHRFLRHPLVPTQTITILFALGLFACFAFSVTTFMFHILSTDKAPRPWRAYCQEQRPFPHDLADSLAPVDVFVGVFSVDAAYERRHLIRSTYLRHSKPIDPYTGRPGHNVQLKFILGRPRKHHARRIALEMETYDDIVVLDMRENMNQGKTHAFFKWANENATVPIFYKPPTGKKIGRLGPSLTGEMETNLNLGFKKADYVVKADDDSFLVLSELERHLRVAPRQGTYWGYLIRNLFMGGECYALSTDLVNYIATSPPLEAYTTGAEDKRVAKWMRMHPNASSINWITERCYVYDHPKAATTYSHGFLFPDEVERVRQEARTGISAAEKSRRGGELADAWSTVSKWKQAYVKPKAEMTMEEEVEALVEGGGRWSALDGWTNKLSSKDVVQWDAVVFDSVDERIKGGPESARRADQARAEHNLRSDTSFGKYNKMPNSLIRDPGDTDIRPQHAKRSYAFWKRSSRDSDAVVASVASESTSTALDSFANISSSAAPEEVRQAGVQYPIGRSPNFKQGYSFLPDPQINLDAIKHKAIPAPTLRYNPSAMSVRERRFLGLPYGGTVVVHYLKRNEWFLETALALLGREKMWDTGVVAPAYPPHVPPPPPGKAAPQHPESPSQGKEINISPVPTWNGRTGEIELVNSQWGGARMYGSPLIRENGFVSLGRTVPWDALQKSEDLKYGKLKGSPRQRYAEMPSSSSSSFEYSDNQSGSSSSSPIASRSPAEDRSDLPSEDVKPTSSSSESHSHSSSSSLENKASHHSSSSSSFSSSSLSSSLQSTHEAGLNFQNPALAALNLH